MIEVSVDDAQVRRSLGRLLGADGRRVLRDGRKRAADLVVAEMPRQRLTAQQRRFGAGVKPRATVSGAAVGFASTRARPTVAVFFGATRKTGWYARPWHARGRGRQFPRWVGNAFDTGWGGSRGRPAGMGEAERAVWPQVERALGDAWVDAFESKGE